MMVGSRPTAVLLGVLSARVADWRRFRPPSGTPLQSVANSPGALCELRHGVMLHLRSCRPDRSTVCAIDVCPSQSRIGVQRHSPLEPSRPRLPAEIVEVQIDRFEVPRVTRA